LTPGYPTLTTVTLGANEVIHSQALARAVYARRNLIILDDVLSALDATTERHIVDNLIGPHGLFKELGATVLLITHASKYHQKKKKKIPPQNFPRLRF